MKPETRRRNRREEGFTLVEILVVITIIAALISIVAAVIPRATQANRKVQCANNLKNIGSMLQERMAGTKGIGTAGGSAMLLQVYSKWYMIRKGDERVFKCPGDPRQQNLDDPDFLKRYESIDLENIDPELISYAGLNRAIYPLKMDSREKQAMAVDCQGSDGRTGHHPDGVNCLYDDSSVLFLDRETLGIGPDDPIVVGPESSQDLLKKFIVR